MPFAGLNTQSKIKLICISYFSGLKILFNTDKSKIIHFGFNNNEASHV